MQITTRDKAVMDIFDQKQRDVRRAYEKRDRIKENWRAIKNKGFAFAEKGMPPVILDYERGRYLFDVMQNNQWKDQRCFIIGGGKSLEKFDFSKLKNELVIGVNRAFEKVNCIINFAMDYQLHDWIIGGKLGREVEERFHAFKGYKVWLDSAGYNYPKGIHILNDTKDRSLSFDMKRGISGWSNAGFGAVDLAVCLGANPIYLLGFDMKGENGKQAWWHGGYPDNQGAGVYLGFINDFKRIVPQLHKKGIRVINLNSDSAMTCFEFGKFEDIQPIKHPIITSYYTKGTGYEIQSKFLIDTLKLFNLEYDIQGIEDRGNWRKNTYYKPIFIKSMLNKYPGRPIVFVDADAKFRQYPILFNDYDCDFACHFRGGKELLSGTLYFGNTKGSHFIVDKWIDYDEKYTRTHMPQRNLQTIFNKNKNKFNWKALPVEYCMIFDCRSRYRHNPVIEHFQLSRQYKERKDRRYEYKMIQDLTEIQAFCHDKKVCLIGNAESILKKKRNIDKEYDVVCRMNRGVPKDKEDFIGKRTDILFLSTGMSGENIKKNFDPRFVIWCTECVRLAQPWVLHNAIQNPVRDWHWLHKKLEKNPSTGMMALYFMLQNIQFKKLMIYGYDFFSTKSWYNTQVDSGLKHSGEKEKKLFGELIKDRKDVILVKT